MSHKRKWYAAFYCTLRECGIKSLEEEIGLIVYRVAYLHNKSPYKSAKIWAKRLQHR